MRWLRPAGGTDDADLAPTASLLQALVARQEPLSAEQRQRMRAATLAAVQSHAPAAAARPAGRRLPRTAAIALAMAAVLVAAGTVAAAESGPGEPFYGVRLAVESWTLPASGNARTQALIAQLERRLSEARDENSHGNANGVADAVRAYSATLDEISAGIGQDVSDAAVEAALKQHLAVLDSLLGSAPASAQQGLQRARDRAQQALQHRPAQPGPGARPSHAGPPSAPPGRP